MSHTNRLELVRIVIPVTDIGHIVSTIDNLAEIRNALPVNHLDIELRIGAAEIGQQKTLAEILAIVTKNQQTLEEIRMNEQQVTDLLTKIDTTTNAIAANVQAVSDSTQTISTELDALIAAGQSAGISDAAGAKLQDLADRLQKTSDASDADVAALRAVAAKGAPVTPPPPPPVQVP